MRAPLLSGVFEQRWDTWMCSDWSRVCWRDLAVLEYGKALRDYQSAESGTARVYGTNGPIGWTSDPLGSGPTVIIGRKGAYRGVHYAPGPFWVIDTAYWLRPVVPLNPRWAYYQLLTQDINGRDSGSAIPSLSRPDFYSLGVHLPPRAEQDAIAEVLGALDDKIENQRRAARLCQELAVAIVDAATADAARVTTVGDIAEFHNRRRVPLSGRERAERQGGYPYYGAAGVIDNVDDYLFDGVHVLVGEDGTVTSDGQHPMVQYVWGRFWVNNHAHVLTGSGISEELLRCVLARADVTAALTGAVQPKLSMGNLKAVEVALPANSSRISPRLRELGAAERAAHAQITAAERLRGALLLPLISGQLRMRDAESLVGEAV